MPTGDTPRRRRVALDLRLVLGLALVAASVAGVVGIVQNADRRTVVYAAAGALSPGDRIDAGDLVERSVALDGADGFYLAEGGIPDDGLIVTQAVREGELLPVSSLGSTAGLRATAIVLPLSSPVSGAIAPGGTVDVWAAPAGDGQSFGPPIVLAPGATVARLREDDGFVAGSGSVSVEVLVPRSRVARLLQAIANGDALAVVPAGLPMEG